MATVKASHTIHTHGVALDLAADDGGEDVLPLEPLHRLVLRLPRERVVAVLELGAVPLVVHLHTTSL